MTAVFVANGLAFGAWAGNIPRLRSAHGLNDASLGVVLLCVSLGAVAAMPLAGRYAERIGTARACIAAAVLLAFALPLPSAAPGWGALLAAAVVLGLALGGLDVSMNAHASAMERHEAAPVMSSYHAGWSFGQLAGAGVASALVGSALPWAMILPGIPVGLLGLLALRLPNERVPASGASFAWPSRAMLGICVLAGLSFTIEGAVADWSGVYLRTDIGAPPALASSSLAAFAAIMLLCRLAGDGAVRRMGPVQVVRWGGAITAAGLLGAVLSNGVWTAAASFALVGVGVANTVPVLFNAAGQRGAAGVAMMATVGYGAVMGAPPLIGFVANAVGLRLALVMVVASAMAVVALARFADATPSGAKRL